MKTIRLWIACLSLITCCAGALTAQDGGSRFGIRAGFQTSQLRTDVDELFNNNQNRYFVGVYKESWLVPLLRMQLGLEYYETGSRQPDLDLKLGYLSVPAALQANFGLFNVYGGISGAMRLYAQERADDELLDIPNDKYRRFDYSTFVGGGVTILFVGIDIRHHWGKTDVYNGFQNRFWQMGATLKF